MVYIISKGENLRSKKMTDLELKKLEELRVLLKANEVALNTTIERNLQELTKMKIKYNGRTVSFVKENGKLDFGSSFDFYYDTYHWSEQPNDELTLDYGSCGSFTKNDKYQLERIKLMGNIISMWDYFSQIWKFNKDQNAKDTAEFEELQRRKDKEDREANEAIRMEEKKTIMAKIKPGNIYLNKDANCEGRYGILIISVTEKNVWYKEVRKDYIYENQEKTNKTKWTSWDMRKHSNLPYNAIDKYYDLNNPIRVNEVY